MYLVFNDVCMLLVSQSVSSDQRTIPPEDVVSWYFRDSRSTPLDLDHDVSGSDISDDEDISRNPPWDLAHLNEVHICSNVSVCVFHRVIILYLQENCTRCAGFLLKQSSKDPNLWRKRFCILAVKYAFICSSSPPPK